MIDLVLCTHKDGGKKYLFEAPPDSKFRRREIVKVDTSHGEKIAHIEEACTVDPNDKIFAFILECCNANIPLRRVTERLVENTAGFTVDVEWVDYSDESEELKNITDFIETLEEVEEHD